jgi:hypothetical protein
MDFNQHMKEWIQMDNQIKLYNEKIKVMRERKNNLNVVILDYANKNNLVNRNILLNDTKVKIGNTNISSPLTFKYIETCLSEVIRNETQVKQILDYIKKKREIKSILEIKRLTNN